MNDFRPPREPLVLPGQIELHARDMTATLAGDISLATVQAHLIEAGQWIPIDGDLAASIADLILFNSTGPLRLGFGGWRDLLLGVQFTNGRGELISAGGSTVKNVAGYDLTKFIVGSAGMFGRIVSATVRTYRRPEFALRVTYDADVHLVGRIMPTASRPQWAILTSEQLFCGYLGDRRTLDHYKTLLTGHEPLEVIERSVDEDIADRAKLWRAEGETTFRAAVPPMLVAELGADLDCQAWVGDPAFGIVLGSHITEDRRSLIRDAAAQLGGSLRFIERKSDGSVRVDFSTNPVERQIIEKLKQAFDPDGNLVPLPWQAR